MGFLGPCRRVLVVGTLHWGTSHRGPCDEDPPTVPLHRDLVLGLPRGLPLQGLPRGRLEVLSTGTCPRGRSIRVAGTFKNAPVKGTLSEPPRRRVQRDLAAGRRRRIDISFILVLFPKGSLPRAGTSPLGPLSRGRRVQLSRWGPERG
eukprot:CAMPEP_0184105328 /NCGR_PEP_ID=MMETSP0974-20121125/14817_1 /TAXON_ID=483370 /ORGANISM="non described non described, Strain CCMP2097" /LENGTH=147 /DNA_ID=CAMNT_0026408335 /DNA_START=445 /DNA_END=884 /DNA_ORIENTATION=+